jgi:uncharacterized protein (TIGR02266 family)
MSETRKDRRAPLSLKVRFKSATVDEFIEQYSGDISRGGIFIKTKSPMAIGTLLKFEFQLKDESRIIHGVGRVVWTRDKGVEGDADRSPGMGIKFIKMDPESQATVDSIVAGRGDSSGEFESKPAETPKVGSLAPKDGAGRESSPGARAQLKDAGNSLASALKDADPELARQAALTARDDEPTGKQPLDLEAHAATKTADTTPKKVVLEKDARASASAQKIDSKRPAPAAASAASADKPLPWGPIFLVLCVIAVAAFFLLRGSPEAPQGGSAANAPQASAPEPTPPAPVPTPAPDAEVAVAVPDAAAPAVATPAPPPENPVALSFVSNVPGATFAVDGVTAGPGMVIAGAGSEVTVTAKAVGYADATQTVKVGAKPKQIVRVNLLRLPHVVIAETTPPGATVFAGMASAVAPNEVVLKAVPPAVVISAVLPGHKRANVSVPVMSFALEDGRMVYRTTFELTPLPKPAPAMPATTTPKKPLPGTESGMPPPVNLNEAAPPASPPPAAPTPAPEAPPTPTP